MASGGVLVATGCSAMMSAQSELLLSSSSAVEVLQNSSSSTMGQRMETSSETCPTTAKSSSSSSSSATTARKQLQLCSGASMIPHPEKAHRGGEDALFIHNSGLGVADGVGSWILQGVDAGYFARSLMLESRKALDAGLRDPGKIMAQAHEATKARGLRGSSTAVVLVLVDDVLHSANLGDSSYMVIRGGGIHHKEQEQTHGFNTPYQLGHESARADSASAAASRSLVVQPGDVIVVGSDGLFDNMYASRIVELATQTFPARALETATTRAHTTSSPGRPGIDNNDNNNNNNDVDTVMEEIEETSEKVQLLAERIAEEAHATAASKTKRVPFGDAAEQHGMLWRGGKMDDITVCVSLVTGPSTPPPPSTTARL